MFAIAVDEPRITVLAVETPTCAQQRSFKGITLTQPGRRLSLCVCCLKLMLKASSMLAGSAPLSTAERLRAQKTMNKSKLRKSAEVKTAAAVPTVHWKGADLISTEATTGNHLTQEALEAATCHGDREPRVDIRPQAMSGSSKSAS